MIVNKHNHDVMNSLVWRRKTGIASRGIQKNYVVRYIRILEEHNFSRICVDVLRRATR